MNLTHISLVTIPVTDQGRAKDFYTGMLDFTVRCDTAMDAATAGGAGGVKPDNEVQNAPWGRWFGVDDPDGNNCLITQERDGS